MPERAAEALLLVVGLHLALGIVFAIAFHLRGIARIDPAAAHATWGFRLLVTPGIAALWPLLARTWWRARGPRR